MFRNLAIVAVAAAIASPAVAQSQLERSLGVEPGVYSTARLVDLKSALANDDRDRVHFILSQPGDQVQSRAATVETDELSANERRIIASALEDNDFSQAAYIANGGHRGTGAGTDIYKAQLARSLGVDGDAYTLTQLLRLENEYED